MTTSFHVFPPSCVTKTPFHTHALLLAGSRSFAPTTTLFTSFGLMAIHVSSFGPGLWLARASHVWPHDAFVAFSWEPSAQSTAQPATLVEGVAFVGLFGDETQPATTRTTASARTGRIWAGDPRSAVS